MASTREASYRLRACTRCGGDAFLDTSDEPEWRCLQCARPVKLTLAAARPVAEASVVQRAA